MKNIIENNYYNDDKYENYREIIALVEKIEKIDDKSLIFSIVEQIKQEIYKFRQNGIFDIELTKNIRNIVATRLSKKMMTVSITHIFINGMLDFVISTLEFCYFIAYESDIKKQIAMDMAQVSYTRKTIFGESKSEKKQREFEAFLKNGFNGRKYNKDVNPILVILIVLIIAACSFVYHSFFG